MRNFLVTKIICSGCGNVMELSPPETKVAVAHSEGEPTGADMLARYIMVEPCKQCMKPAERVIRAVRELVDAAEEIPQQSKK